jgi:hypothetical protein
MPIRFWLFLISLVLSGSFCFACRKTGNANQNGLPTKEPGIKIETLDPETFQADVVFSIEGGSTKKIFIAKNSENQLIKFGDETGQLQKGKKIFILNYRKKLFAEANNKSKLVEEKSDFRFLISPLLNNKYQADVKYIGTENGLDQYLVKLDNSSKSEIVFFYDPNEKIIKKRDYYSLTDSKKLIYSIEIQNFQRQIDPSVFDLPSDFKKVTISEFDEIIWKGRL